MYIIINQNYDEITILGHTSDKDVAEKFVENILLPAKIRKQDVLNNNEKIYRENLDKLNLSKGYENWLKEDKLPSYWVDTPITYYIEHGGRFCFSPIHYTVRNEIGIQYVPEIPWVYIMESDEIQ